MALVAGVDCSTQATKVLVVDAERGQVIGEGRAPHEVTGADGARETDPAVWWDALATALAATGRAADVDAIAVAAQQHGMVVAGQDGRPLRPATLWNDTRSAPDADRLRESLGGAEEWAQRIGSVPVASFTITSWAWLRRTEPDVAAAARSLRLPHDWLTERLCSRGVTDRGDASGTGYWSVLEEAYLPKVLGLPEVDLDPELLPDVLGPVEPAGTVTAGAGEALGLSPGTLVGPGTGDNMGAALGLGLEPGTPVLSLGTSGTAYLCSERPAADGSGVVAGFADATGRFLPLACTLNCTLAVDRVAAWLGLDREAAEPGDGVVVLPYLDGERTPDLPDAAGMVAGLRHDTTSEQLLGAAYEGAVASLLDALDALDAHSSGLNPAAAMILIGGGARGRAWREVVARLSGRALRIPAAQELVALGAAAQAAALLLNEPPDVIARRWNTCAGIDVESVEPDQAARERIRQVRHAAAPLLRTR